MLVEHAQVDPLTGLPNRRALLERLHHEWARIQRHDGNLSFIMADVDHFKRINDTYGHTLGDAVLQKIAQTICQECRQIDLPSRYGGDEFAILVPDEDAQCAANLADRCRQRIEESGVPAGQETVRATATLGVADARGASSPEALIQQADIALYQAKVAGRNRVQVQEDSTVAPSPPEDLEKNRLGTVPVNVPFALLSVLRGLV